MPDPAAFGQAHASHWPAAVAMASAVLGFAGAMVLLYATWSTLRLRKAILQGVQIDTDDPRIKEGVAVLLGKLNGQQLDKLHEEYRLSVVGAALLAVGFLLSFLHELL